MTGTRGAEAVLDASGSSQKAALHIGGAVTDVVIDGLTFSGAGIVSNAVTRDITIRNNRFVAAAFDGVGAISAYEGQTQARNWTIRHNVIDPGVKGSNSGIALATIDDVTMADNVIANTGHSGVQLNTSRAPAWRTTRCRTRRSRPSASRTTAVGS